MRYPVWCVGFMVVMLLISAVQAIDEAENTGAGTAVLRGSLTFTNTFFADSIIQPLIVLEDQGGFVTRNKEFQLSLESQILGQITSDVSISPFSYVLRLPIEPAGTLHDVDQDQSADEGVMIFAVAYWSNLFGDPYLERRDIGRGGWSMSYTSTRISDDLAEDGEIIGGKFIIYASDDEQGFPSDFGADGRLFTEDDPISTLPAGYTVVDMDTHPFTLLREHEATVDLFEAKFAASDNFSQLNYVAAFDAMLTKLSQEYAFTEYRQVDWAALGERYRPRFERAQTANDSNAYALAMRDFIWEIPDGHVSMSFTPYLQQQAQSNLSGGLGIALAQLDDGRVIVNYVTRNGVAAEAGIDYGAEIIALDGVPIEQALENVFVWSHEALATPIALRLQQLRYVTRYPLGTKVAVTFRNADRRERTVTLTAASDFESFTFSSLAGGYSPTNQPLEYRVLPSGYGYIAIHSFFDDEQLTLLLWERALTQLKAAGVPGIILDMRVNEGGWGYLADLMTGYFFDEEGILVGQSAIYNDATGEFILDEDTYEEVYLPPREDRYLDPLAVLVSPACYSACEFFTYNLTLQNRALIVGMYPTGGLGGGVDRFEMPDGIQVQFTRTRRLDMAGEIHIEGKGIAPTLRVPITEATILTQEDVILQAAEQAITRQLRGNIRDGGALQLTRLPDTLITRDTLAVEESIQYLVTIPGGARLNVYLEGDNPRLDTVLRLYDASGSELLFENDNANRRSVSSAIEDLETIQSAERSITFMLEVTLAEGVQRGGDFTLTIAVEPVD